MDGQTYYAHSGRFTIPGLIIGLVAGVAAASVLAVVYGYLVQYNPFIYINALGSLAFGAAIGFVTAYVLKNAKVRNNTVAALCGLMAGLAGLYVSWSVWLFALLRRADEPVSFLAILLQPAEAWTLIQNINEVGAWTIGKTAVTGIVLWIVWAIEALVITGCAAGVAWSNMSDVPFCEQCEQWCETAKGVLVSKSTEPGELRQNMERHNFQFLEKLGAAGSDATEWVRFDLSSCTKCSMTNTLSAHDVRIEIKKGKPEEKTSEVLSGLLVSASESQALRQLGQQKTPPAGPVAGEG